MLKVAEDLPAAVERAATMERTARRAGERAAGQVTNALAVRADADGSCGNHRLGARIASERTLGPNSREQVSGHLVAAEHSDKGAQMSPG